MPKVFTKDKVELFEVTQQQARSILQSCPNIVRAKCSSFLVPGPKAKGQKKRERIIETITIRLNLNRVKEWVEQAYASESAALRTHYRVLFECGLWCWSQKRLTESGQFAKWPGERSPFGVRVVQSVIR